MSRKKKVTTNQTIIKLKIVFLLTLIAAGFLMTQLVKSPKGALAQKSERQKEQFRLPKLGDVKGIMDSLSVEGMKKKAEELKKQVLGSSDVLLEEKASQAGALATDFVFDKAINPILDQIKRLPKDQQERLQGQICK